MHRSPWLTIAGILGVSTVLAGCAGSPATTSVRSAGAGNGGSAARAYEVWVQSAGSDASSSFTVIDPSGGGVLRSIPAGLPSADSRHVYRAVPQGAGTLLSAVDPATGRVSASLHLPYPVAMPTMDAGNVAPLTPDGRVLVLAHQDRTAAGAIGESSFAVVDRGLSRAPSLIRLPGSWRYDGVNADGTNLFLIEDLTATPSRSYHVRRYDLVSDRLDPTVIVAKGETESTMTGVGVARAFLGGGSWQFTLYADGSKGAFIHALDLNQDNLAICVDIPGTPTSGHEGYWSLLAGTQGTAVAVNGATGNLAVLQLNGIPGMQRSVRVAVPGALLDGPPGGLCCTPVDGAAVLGTDGRTVYAATPAGVAVFDTTTMTLRGAVGAGLQPRSLAGAPDGGLVVATGSRVLFLDVAAGKPPRLLWEGGKATGEVIGVEVPGG
ncbi:MAG TPA: hypothetical protein VI316_01105 [Candidatus Dormibacteraeota bacterium]